MGESAEAHLGSLLFSSLSSGLFKYHGPIKGQVPGIDIRERISYLRVFFAGVTGSSFLLPLPLESFCRAYPARMLILGMRMSF
jgi:hypothetical protein